MPTTIIVSKKDTIRIMEGDVCLYEEDCDFIVELLDSWYSIPEPQRPEKPLRWAPSVPKAVNTTDHDDVMTGQPPPLELSHEEQVVHDALKSQLSEQRRIAETGLQWLTTLLAKNHDYGSTVWDQPTLAPHLDAGDAILVRMSDKVGRIRTLMSTEQRVKDESLEDTINDLGSYCLLWLARPKPNSGPRVYLGTFNVDLE